jgi:hypothetical protein
MRGGRHWTAVVILGVGLAACGSSSSRGSDAPLTLPASTTTTTAAPATTTTKVTLPPTSTTSTIPNPYPIAPTGLHAGPGPGSGEVVLHWNQNLEPDIVGYIVYRGKTRTGPTIIAAHVSRATVALFLQKRYFVDVPGGIAYYKVRAVDAAGQIGPPSHTACGAPPGLACP